jgi:hypothetical protein
LCTKEVLCGVYRDRIKSGLIREVGFGGRGLTRMVAFMGVYLKNSIKKNNLILIRGAT